MTPTEEAALMAEVEALDASYAGAAAFDEAAAAANPCTTTDEEEECFDPVRDGWVGRDGRP
jgi:hypothetical protein